MDVAGHLTSTTVYVQQFLSTQDDVLHMWEVMLFETHRSLEIAICEIMSIVLHAFRRDKSSGSYTSSKYHVSFRGDATGSADIGVRCQHDAAPIYSMHASPGGQQNHHAHLGGHQFVNTHLRLP